GFAGSDGDAGSDGSDGSDGAAKSDGSDGSGSGPGGGGHKPRLVLVVPDGDDYPVTRELAAALAEPAEVVVVPRDWATLI
ncbi:MAG: hypothetical protein J2P58_07620, partial [Acidimicrobiaceae bacterium]|nr:hypothetical protein [Acidimicrobiaceae bacterium]